MKPYRLQQKCRSYNPFSPSIALWQYFILPHQLLRSQRLSSSRAETTPERGTDIRDNPTIVSPHAPAGQLENTTPGQNEANFPIRKVSWPKEVGRRSRYPYGSSTKASGAIVELLVETRLAYDNEENYKGRVIEPHRSAEPVSEHSLPWCDKDPTATEKASRKRLTSEISRFHEYAKPTRAEALARRHVIEQVKSDVRSILSANHVLEVFGSERMNIALATSDIDLRLMKRKDHEGTNFASVPSVRKRKKLLKELWVLRKFLLNKEYVQPELRHARYPLISMQHHLSGLDVQVVLANDTSRSRRLVQQYMQMYPYLGELYSVIKTIFDVRALSDVFHGGFGSYPIFMMIVASLKHVPNERGDAAEGLINFLGFWGYHHPSKGGVSIEPAEIFDKNEQPVLPPRVKHDIAQGKKKPQPDYLLSLRDPADETNDLGRKGISINHVQVTLRHILWQLKKDMKENSRPSLLKPLVGDIYSLNMVRRQKLEQYGLGVLKTMQVPPTDTAEGAVEQEDDGGPRESKDEEQEQTLHAMPEELGAGSRDEAISDTQAIEGSESDTRAQKDDIPIAYEQDQGDASTQEKHSA